MRAHDTTAPRTATRPRNDPNVEDLPWIVEGLSAGLFGAVSIAAYFGILDLVAGRPLFTPHALGSVLFHGALPTPGAPTELVLAAAYTAMHATVFTAVGFLVAFEVFSGTKLPGRTGLRRNLLLTIVLFLVFQLLFLGFDVFVGRGIGSLLGYGHVSFANLLAAGAMSLYLRGAGERYAAETTAMESQAEK